MDSLTLILIYLFSIVCHVFVVTTAQDLLEQWAADKLNFNDDHLDSDYLEIQNTGVQSSKMAAEVKCKWDRLVQGDSDDCLTSVCGLKHNGHSSQNSKQQKNKGSKSHSVS